MIIYENGRKGTFSIKKSLNINNQIMAGKIIKLEP